MLRIDPNLVAQFCERTRLHKELVSKYGIRCGYSFPEHDCDKFLHIREWYALMLKPDLNQMEKECLDQATFIHATSQPHHPEYWTSTDLTGFTRVNYCPNGIVEALRMPKACLIEMAADWCATAYERGSSPLDWANKVIGVKWKFSPDQTKVIYSSLDRMWKEPLLCL